MQLTAACRLRFPTHKVGKGWPDDLLGNDRAMSVTDELLQNAEAYASSFDNGDLPLLLAKTAAACEK